MELIIHFSRKSQKEVRGTYLLGLTNTSKLRLRTYPIPTRKMYIPEVLPGRGYITYYFTKGHIRDHAHEMTEYVGKKLKTITICKQRTDIQSSTEIS